MISKARASKLLIAIRNKMDFSLYRIQHQALVGEPHVALFLQTKPAERKGNYYEVLGDIQNGVYFEHRYSQDGPENIMTFESKLLLGKVDEGDVEKVLQTCRGIAAPVKQFEKNKHLFPGRPLRRCTMWTEEVIKALTDKKVVIVE